MAAFAFVGLAVTSSTVAIFGVAIPDPIALLGRLEGTAPMLLALAGGFRQRFATNV
jgi:nucleobase:cation symporter-1, NCS1 family